MKKIKDIIVSETEPSTKEVLWIQPTVSNSEYNLKYFTSEGYKTPQYDRGIKIHTQKLQFNIIPSYAFKSFIIQSPAIVLSNDVKVGDIVKYTVDIEYDTNDTSPGAIYCLVGDVLSNGAVMYSDQWRVAERVTEGSLTVDYITLKKDASSGEIIGGNVRLLNGKNVPINIIEELTTSTLATDSTTD